MTFDLTCVAERVRAHAADWHALLLAWTDREISPNYGKATTGARFEGAGWLGEVSVWDTGETELETLRASDGYGVNKHYDLLDAAGLDGVLAELIALVRDGAVPDGAFTYFAR